MVLAILAVAALVVSVPFAAKFLARDYEAGEALKASVESANFRFEQDRRLRDYGEEIYQKLVDEHQDTTVLRIVGMPLVESFYESRRGDDVLVAKLCNLGGRLVADVFYGKDKIVRWGVFVDGKGRMRTFTVNLGKKPVVYLR